MPTPLLSEEEDLTEAVKGGREAKVRTLLMCGARVDVVDKEGKTPFHWACQYGHLNILCLLLSHVPAHRPSTTSDSEQSRVCSMCRHSRRIGGVVHKAEHSIQNQPENFLECQDHLLSRETESDDDSHMGSKGHIDDKGHIGDEGHIVDGRQLVPLGEGRGDSCLCNSRQASHIINTRDTKGQTPLHVACNYRRADVASFLVTLPFCDINVSDRAGNTPLHRAIHNELDNLACLLCDAGADVRAANAQLQTPLHEAIRSANENVVRTLLNRGCDVNAVTKCAAAPTPFLTAVFYYKISMRSSDYATFLDTTLRLLIESGCKLSYGDYQWSPLSAAIDIDNSVVASLLLFNGCRFQKNYSRRGYGRSLLVEAFTHCEVHVVRLLVLCGYQPNLEEVDQCSRRIPSFSPLFYRISGSERVAMRSKSELLVWLRRRACGARSLMELSRTCVRQALNQAGEDTSILKRIPELPLPKVLRQYVALSDFTENRTL